MNSRENISIKGESRLMDTTELRAYTNLGKNMATKLGIQNTLKENLTPYTNKVTQKEKILLQRLELIKIK